MKFPGRRQVLHALAWPGELSGAFRSMEETLVALTHHGVDARAWLACPRSVGHSAALQRLDAAGLNFRVHRTSAAADPRAVASLTGALRQQGPNALLHTHGERALLWGRAASRVAGVPHVHTQHGFVADDVRGQLRVVVGKQLAQGLDQLIAVDEATTAGLDAIVVPNCLNTKKFVAEALPRDAARRRLELAREAPVLLFMGRLSPEKGVGHLNEIAETLGQLNPRARLLLVGGGPWSARLGGAPNLVPLGPRDDPATLLRAADVLIMPSRSEGLPMVALEAAALATPVVSFPAGGLPASGLAEIVAMGDVLGLTQRALALAVEGKPRRDRILRASEALSQRFSPEKNGTALAAIYESL